MSGPQRGVSGANKKLFVLVLFLVALVLFANTRHAGLINMARPGPIAFQTTSGSPQGEVEEEPLLTPTPVNCKRRPEELGDMTDDDLYAFGSSTGGSSGADGDSGDELGISGMHVFKDVCAIPSTTGDSLELFPSGHSVVKRALTDGVKVVKTITKDVFLHRNWCHSHAFGRGLSAWFGASRASMLKGDRTTAIPLLLGRQCSQVRPVGRDGYDVEFDDIWLMWINAVFASFKQPASALWHDALKQGSIDDHTADGILLLKHVLRSSEVVCFNKVYEWHNSWMWFPTLHAAHGLRTSLWTDHGKLTAQTERQNEWMNVPFKKQRRPKIVLLSHPDYSAVDVSSFLKKKFGSVAEIVVVNYGSNSSGASAAASQLVEQMSTADVLIGSHHASYAAILALPPGGVVIELFPFNARSYAFEQLAQELKLHHYAVESEPSPIDCCASKPVTTAMHFSLTESGMSNDRRALSATGANRCGVCKVAVEDHTWYYTVKNALATVWLRNSRLSKIHDFDVRR